MTRLRPYLIRAVYDWILDNSLTPFLLVNAEDPHAHVPTAYVQEGRITLNLRPEAVQNLFMGDRAIEFQARFGGKPTGVRVPISAILALYAKENGRGMVFEPEPDEENDEPPEQPPEPPTPIKKDKPTKPRPSFLTVVK